MSLADEAAWINDHPVKVETINGAVNLESEVGEEIELVDELVSTTTLYDLFGRFITQMDQTFTTVEELSEEGNPVRTHLAILGAYEELTTAAHQLRDELIEKLAQRGERITEKGGTLRRQVLEDEDEDS